MNWSDEQVLKFINLYKDRPELWDPALAGYKNKNKRHELLIELSNWFDIDKSEVEKKIRCLQSQFARERKKETNYKKSGSKRDEAYTSKWFAYKSMMFLVDKQKSRKKTETKFQVPEHQETDEEESASNDYQNKQIKMRMRSSTKEIRKESMCLKKSNLILRRKKDSYSDEKQQSLNQALSLMRTIQNKMEDKDEYTLFGEQVAVRLRKIPSLQARFDVQNIINKALFDGEMGVFA